MAGSPGGHYALRFIAGRFKGGEFPLRPNREIVVGRGSEFDMVLDEDMVSRRHAKILTLHGQIVLQDLKSTNGTFVNGERINVTRLKLGDKVLIGSSIMELVEVERSSPGLQLRADTSRGPAANPARATEASPAATIEAVPGSPKSSFTTGAQPVVVQTSAAMPALTLNVPRPTLAPPPPSAAPRLPPPPPPPPAAAAVLRPPAKSAPTSAMSGRVPDDVAQIPDLFDLFLANKRTGQLTLRDVEGQEAQVFLKDGQVVFASLHGAARHPEDIDLTVDPAKSFYRLVAWPAAQFRLDATALPPLPVTLQSSTQELVAEGVRLSDELRQYQPHMLPRDARLQLLHPLEQRLSGLSAEALDTLQVIWNVGLVGRILDHSGASDLETWQDIFYLLQNGYITTA